MGFSPWPPREQQAWASPCAGPMAAACQQPWLCSRLGQGDITKLLRSERGGEQDPKSPKNRVSNRGPALQAGLGPGASCAAQPGERPVVGRASGQTASASSRRAPVSPARAPHTFRAQRESRTCSRPPTRVGGGGAARRRGRIPGSDATTGARRAFPPLANGFALARRGFSCDPGPAPGTLAMDGEAALWLTGWLPWSSGACGGIPPLPPPGRLPPLSAPRVAAQGAAGRMVARGGAACEGSDSVTPLSGGRLDSGSLLGGGVRVNLDSVSSGYPPPPPVSSRLVLASFPCRGESI